MAIISRALRYFKRQLEDGFSFFRVLKLKCLYPGIEINFKTKIEKNCSIICVQGGTLKILNSNIGFGTHIKVDSGGTIKVLDSFIGRNCVITAKSQITLEKGCLIAEMVVIRDQDHDTEFLSSSGNLQKFVFAPICIKENVWIASKATILKGVSIGRGSVVAASAVVTKNIEPGELWGGVPAKFIKNLTRL